MSFGRSAGGEILRPHPGIESLQTEVDRVRAILDGGPDTFPVARRRQYLRPPQGTEGGRDCSMVVSVMDGMITPSAQMAAGFRAQSRPREVTGIGINAGPDGCNRKLDPEH